MFFWAFHWPLQVGWPYRHTHMVSLFPSLKKPHCVRFGGIWKAVLCAAASPLQMPRTSDFSVVSTSPERLKSVLKKQKMILLGCCVRASEWEKDQRLRMMSLHTFSTLKGCRLKAATMYSQIRNWRESCHLSEDRWQRFVDNWLRLVTKKSNWWLPFRRQQRSGSTNQINFTKSLGLRPWDSSPIL